VDNPIIPSLFATSAMFALVTMIVGIIYICIKLDVIGYIILGVTMFGIVWLLIYKAMKEIWRK
jgi:hypothetical protein